MDTVMDVAALGPAGPAVVWGHPASSPARNKRIWSAPRVVSPSSSVSTRGLVRQQNQAAFDGTPTPDAMVCARMLIVRLISLSSSVVRGVAGGLAAG
ncbi:hypothetical protein PAPYR_9069 [Paratrimastix pyriformis]|uniref:Uncharacterized protein n=1 Tax=Paratrimastix pyriformis TaxID=342808 RepID=A0ABQ8U962_9EUKA|nr:hypothetical protein PAPYR_9069 [Paratrimastix pyriformis]